MVIMTFLMGIGVGCILWDITFTQTYREILQESLECCKKWEEIFRKEL
jgi:hypothetical protein